MTNTYGGEPNDHDASHDHGLSHDQEVVREAPSDYEFADDHGSPIAEEHNEEPTSSETEAKTKGRSPLLPIVAAVGGVVLLGAVAWWQFGSSKTGAAPQAAMPVLSSSAEPAKAPPPPSPSDPNAFPASTVAPTTNAMDPAALANLNGGNTSSAPPPAAPSTPMAMMAPGGNPATPGMPGAPSQSSNTQLDSRIDALNARMDEVQHSLDQAVQQLGQVTNMVAMPAKDVQDRLDKIEQQLADLHHSAPKLASPSVLPGDMAVPANSGLPASPTKIKTHPTVTSAHAPAVHVAHKTSHAKEAATPSKASSTPNWVLRAASPGEAWIATDASTHDLKQVQVGDTLPGIGKVVAISQLSGNWVVQGSTGSIQ